MKNKFIKRAFSVALAGTMMVSMAAGCGSKATDGGSTKGTETVDNSDKPDTWIADRTINIQVYVDDIGYTLPKDLNNTPIMKELTKRTGIKLNIQYTPGDDDAKVLASQLAGGTIPDVIITYLDNSTRPEFPLLLKAAREGMFADVSEYMKDTKALSKYAEEGYLPNDAYKNIVYRDEFEGAVYMLQLGVDEVDRSTDFIPEIEYMGGPYIQKKIIDQLGIDPTQVKTSDDLYNLLVKIKEGGFKDDNGNDVWPLGPKYWGGSVDSLEFIIPSLNWGVSGVNSAIGGYNIDDDGNIYHEAETDYIYDKIGYVRKLLDEGLMNPEFFTMDSTRAAEVSKIHNSAIIADVHNYQDIIFQTEDWVPLGPLNDIAGDNKKVTHGKTGRGCLAISSEAENPEEIIKFVDYFATPEGQLLAEYGVEGVSYNMVDGKPVLTDEVKEKMSDGDTDWLINEVGASFGSMANYFFEFIQTNGNPLDNFGENRPGSATDTTFARSIQLAKDYPREKKLIPGLDASAYLTAPGLEDVKAQMDLLNYKETMTQAYFAKNDDEVKQIVESFRAQLKSSGNDRFKEELKKIYDEDKEAISFYK